MDVFMGTVMSFGFDFAPRNWAQCAGQLVAISTNQALFSLLGVVYGGDGRTTFALPNLQGRTIISQGTDTTGTNWTMGETAGSNTTTLLMPNLPSHIHNVQTTIRVPALADTANTTDPTNNIFAIASGANVYTNAAPNTALRAFPENMVVGITGGSQAFNTMSPYQVVNYCIALYGIFPSRN